MKRLLLRMAGWGMLLSVVASPAIALPKEQIVQRLNVVPVFAVVSQEGRPLIASVKDKDQKEIGIIPIFTDPKSAQSSYEEFRKSAPADLKDKYRLIVLSLGNAVEAARTESQNKESKVRYTFQPPIVAQARALTLAKKAAPELKQFPGVPVFYLGTKSDQPLFFNRGLYFQGKDNKPVIFPKGAEASIPMFLSYQDAQGLLDLMKKSQPTTKLEVQVLGLFQLLELMNDDKNTQLAQAVTFVPEDEALQLVVTLQKSLPTNFFKPAATPPTPTPTTPPPSEPTPQP